MISFCKKLLFSKESRVAFINILPQIEDTLIAASVFINDNESGYILITKNG